MQHKDKMFSLDAEGLVEGVHYDVISYTVMIKGKGITPFDRHFDMDGEVLLDPETFDHYNKELNQIDGKLIKASREHFKDDVQVYFPKHSEIHVSYAVDLGLGVIKFKDHEDIEQELRGRRAIVNCVHEDLFSDQESYLKSLTLRIALYIQVTEKDVDFKNIEKLLNEFNIMDRLILTSDGVMKEVIRNSFAEKKVGKVLNFPER